MQKFQAGLHQIKCLFIKATLSVRHPKKWSSPNYTKCPSTPIGFPCCGQNEDYMNDWLLMILSLALIDFGSLGHFKSFIMHRFVAKPIWHVQKLPQMKRSGSCGHCKYIWAINRTTVNFTRQYTLEPPSFFRPHSVHIAAESTLVVAQENCGPCPHKISARSNRLPCSWPLQSAREFLPALAKFYPPGSKCKIALIHIDSYRKVAKTLQRNSPRLVELFLFCRVEMF